MEGAILRVEEIRVVSIRECKIDKGGDLHHGSLPTYTSDFPDPLFPSYSYIHVSGPRWLIGDCGGGRERPPFFASRIGLAGWRNLHSRGTPWEGRSRPKNPCGKAV